MKEKMKETNACNATRSPFPNSSSSSLLFALLFASLLSSGCAVPNGYSTPPTPSATQAATASTTAIQTVQTAAPQLPPGGAAKTPSAGAAGEAGAAGASAAAGANGAQISFTTNVRVGGVFTIPAATSGHAYNARITPSGGTPPYNCFPAPGTALPGTLVFSQPGCSITGGVPFLAAGTPTQFYPFSFIVRDSKGAVGGPFNLVLVVNVPSVKLNLPASIDEATAGDSYRYNFCDPSTQSGVNCGRLAGASSVTGTPPYTFTARGLPFVLSMNLNGAIFGDVSREVRPGTYLITVCVKDFTSTESCADTNLPVKQGPSPTPESGSSPAPSPEPSCD